MIATPYPLKYKGRNQKNYTLEIAQCVDGAQTAGVEIAPTIRSEHHNMADVHFVPEVNRAVRSGGRGSPQGSKQEWDNVGGIRRLTPLETERLQGFPDNWTAKGIDDNGKEVEISDTQRYKMCGNAVTTNVIAHFGRAFRRLT